MNKLVWFDGTNFAVRDAKGYFHYPTADELSKYATKSEIAAALHNYEGQQTPLPQYSVEHDAYYWSDTSDLWSAEDVAADAALIWPGMPVELLLLSARLMAKLGIKD